MAYIKNETVLQQYFGFYWLRFNELYTYTLRLQRAIFFCCHKLGQICWHKFPQWQVSLTMAWELYEARFQFEECAKKLFQRQALHNAVAETIALYCLIGLSDVTSSLQCQFHVGFINVGFMCHFIHSQHELWYRQYRIQQSIITMELINHNSGRTQNQSVNHSRYQLFLWSWISILRISVLKTSELLFYCVEIDFTKYRQLV